MRQYDWILDVLTDLSRFADNERLSCTSEGIRILAKITESELKNLDRSTQISLNSGNLLKNEFHRKINAATK